MNNDGAGAAHAKGGDNVKAINRTAGYNATVAAMGSKTRSRYRASSKHYSYEDCSAGYGDNENVVGYKGGNKS